MYQKKKLEARYIVLIMLGIIVIMLGFLTLAVQDGRKLNPVEQVIKDSAVFVNKVAYAPIKFIKDQVDKYQAKEDIYNKYNAIKEKLDQVKLNEARMLELETELEDMQKLLELNKTLSKSSYLNASVVGRNIGFWYNTITIDKGSNNGIKVDMAVINHKGLLGKVIKTSNFTATVKLLTSSDVNNKISVKIKTKDKDVYGLLSKYSQEKHMFIVDGIAENTIIEEGSPVVTSGLGGLFPSGILIGHVNSVDTDNFDLSKMVEVKSVVNYDHLNYVTVVKKVN